MKTDITSIKNKLRSEIAKEKKKYSDDELLIMSEEVFSVFEIIGKFAETKKICIYNAIPGEVQTRAFVEKWRNEKEFYFPVTKEEEIHLCKIEEDTEYCKSPIGIFEPVGEEFREYGQLDMIIVPGMAFDRKGNRLGRGKGYYDRFLKKTKALKIGVCFDFQLLDSIPSDEYDVKMDMIVSENELIW